MSRLTGIVFSIVVLLIPERVVAVPHLDSLLTAWQNESAHDTLRFKALYDYAWDGYLYSQPDSAFYFAQQLHDLALKNDQPDWVARALNLQGNAQIVLGDYFKAFRLFNNSLAISEESGNLKEQANSLHSIGIIYYYQGDNPRAIQHYMRSLKIRESIGDRQGISKSLNNIGIVYSEQKKFGNAYDFFSRSLVHCRELNDRRGEASTLNNLGLIMKEKGNNDSAYTFYMKSMEISESIGDKRDMATVLNNMGHIHRQRGDFEKALELYNKSLSINKLIGDKQGESHSFINIGATLQLQEKHRDAVTFCNKGLVAAEQVGSLVNQESACKCIYENYKILGDRQQALAYHERMLVLTDSIKDAETLHALQHMEFTRQVFADSIARAESQATMERAHQETIRKKNQNRNILLMATMALLIGAVSLYNRVRYIRKSRAEISREKERSENLLLNILPEDIAKELKEHGKAKPRKFENVSILFTDFKDFTQKSAGLTPEELIAELNACFVAFDAISEKYKLEKIKTIGDAYMVAGGLPVACDDSARKTVLAALEMTDFMIGRKKSRETEGKFAFEMRAGIHTGTVVAGIVGLKKFQYDIYGDTVNIASRMEGAGETGKVNISKSTYELIKNDPVFRLRHRGELMVKGKGCTEMYYVELDSDSDLSR
jgi:class 3 adenylate cyclase/Flp pilus assembly protein TadD